MAAVLDVTDYAAPYGGNFVPSLVAVGGAVRERLGLDYRVVLPDLARGREWVSQFEAAGIECDFVERGQSRPRRAARVRALAAEHDAVLLRSHFTVFDPECAYAGRRERAKVIWHSHTGILRFGPKVRLGNILKVRLLGRLCDRLVAVSEELGRLARERGYPAEKVTVVPNGIDFGRFAGERMPPRADARRELGLHPGRDVVLAFCWDAHRKGTDLIVDAVAALHGEPPQVVLVGEHQLRQYVAHHLPGGPPPWLHVVEPVEDAASLFAAADVFVSASREEAFSYAIAEAMGSSLPVISSDIPGPRPFLDSPGVLPFPTEDVGALTDRIAAVLGAGRRAEWGPQNRELALQRFGMDRHVDGMIAVFGELLGR